ncbi:MAG: hypothetical protein S4CHLAM102_09110 [Chlamydiia bacterium]|nr:hypothetical protein [Chlamydiia bacterium]
MNDDFNEQEWVDHPLLDAISAEIIMQRDVHFGGDFQVMIDYYESDGVGASPDYSIEHIKSLQAQEKESKQNLAESLLPSQAREQVEKFQKLYSDLREVYEEKHINPVSIAMSDLILSEEEFPESEINTLVDMGERAVKPLEDLMNSTIFHDTLAAGYGIAPRRAAFVLGKIGHPSSLNLLIGCMGKEGYAMDDALIQAISQYGSVAKELVLNKLGSKPISSENVNAAIIASSLPEDEEIAKKALEIFTDKEFIKEPVILQYLVFTMTALEDPKDRARLANCLENPAYSKDLKDEIQLVLRN